VEHNKGEEIDHFGQYLQVERPERLAFTLEAPKHFPGVTRVRIRIEARANGCAMEFEQTGVDKDVTEESWRAMFATLRGVLEKAK